MQIMHKEPSEEEFEFEVVLAGSTAGSSFFFLGYFLEGRYLIQTNFALQFEVSFPQSQKKPKVGFAVCKDTL